MDKEYTISGKTVFLLVAVFMLVLLACLMVVLVKWTEIVPALTPTPTATATMPVPTATVVETSAPTSTPPVQTFGRPSHFGPGLATPGVSYYVMNDQSYGSIAWDQERFGWCYEYYPTLIPNSSPVCNTDNYGDIAGWPDQGEIGGWAYWPWDMIDRGRTSGPDYNWDVIDTYLRAAYSVDKQVAISIFTYDITTATDRTPIWLLDINYSRTWRMHYAEFVRVFTERYDRPADYQIGTSWIRTSAIKGFWVMTGAYGENNTGGMPNGCGNWIDDDVHWYNYGVPNEPTYSTNMYGCWGHWTGSEAAGYNWDCTRWDDGSLLGPFYVWERWVQYKEMWIIASEGKQLGKWVQWAAEVALTSPRGPIGLKTNTLAYDLPRHRTSLESKRDLAYWELVDPWIGSGQVEYQGNLVEVGGYWSSMNVGQEHAYAANKVQTYWSMLPMITWHANEYDTEPKFFEVLYGWTDWLIDHSLWDFMTQYMTRSPGWFTSGTFRMFRITAQGLRTPGEASRTGGWNNADRYDPVNDWTYDFGHADEEQCMTIVSGADKLLRSAPGWHWPAPEPTTAPDAEWAAAPPELTSNEAVYGRYGFAVLELDGGEFVEIKPYPAGYGNASYDMKVQAIVANYGSQLSLSYNGEMHTTVTMQDGWKVLTLDNVKFSPDATIKLTALTTPSGGENYVHMILFEKTW